MEYFKKNPQREIMHPEIVDWVVEEYKRRTGQVFRDPDRAIRKLSQEGQFIKVAKGIYKYDLDLIKKRELEDFTIAQKEEIFKRDNYRCVICGRGKADGVEIQADHIKSKEICGKAEVSNGQTLCAQHIATDLSNSSNCQLLYSREQKTLGKYFGLSLYICKNKFVNMFIANQGLQGI